MTFRQTGEIEISTDLIYYRADHFKGSALFCIVCRSHEIDSLLTQELTGHIDLLSVLWIVYCYRVAAEHLYDLHTRDISLTISQIDHMRERDPLIVFSLTFIDFLVVPHT